MNNLQKHLFEVIKLMVLNKNLNKEILTPSGKIKMINHGSIRYGFLNYVARFSLANDEYFITKEAKRLLDIKKLINDNGLLRSKKSKKNGFTYEHPIPSNVIGDLLIKNSKSEKDIKEILINTDKVVVLTNIENERLSFNKLNSSMPEGWQYKNALINNSEFFARYKIANIERPKPSSTIKVYGALAR
tara:strand:+ start:81 stop:644 length:564 start_codon:yes stop_codon:yes gene_type:complete